MAAQNLEGKAFVDRIAALAPDAGANALDAVLAPSLEYEANLRTVFATSKEDPLLNDPLVGLVDIFSAPDAIRTTRTREVIDEKDMTAKHVMPLAANVRRATGQPSMVSSLEEFQKNWAVFNEGSLSQLLDWNNVIAAGGSVLACLTPLPERAKASKRSHRKYYHSEAFPTSDVDLFLWGLTPQQAEDKIIKIYEAVRDSVPWDVTVLRTKHSVSIHSQYPYRSVQIILRLYRSPAEVLAGFDVDSCSFAYDGQRVYGNPRAIVSMMRQANTVDMTRRSPSYEVRLSKYADRGYEVYIPSLRREDVDPTIYERAVGNITGLARLLVLEKIKTAETRDAFIDKRRELRSRPAAVRHWRRNKKKFKGDLKEDTSIIGMEMNDYDVGSLHIPYGPGWDARRIEKLVYQTDLGMNSTFNPKNKDRRLHRHPAFFGTAAEVLEDCCECCPEPIDDDERELKKSEEDTYITGRISFIEENPGRQSLSGSFNPIDVGEWSEQVYIGDTEKLFSAIADANIARVRELLDQPEPVDVNRRDHVGRTALHLAILVGASDVALLLIEKGAKMISRLADGRNTLHLAAQKGDVVVLKKLLEKSKENELLVKKDEDDDDAAKTKKVVKDSSEDDWSSDPADGMDVVTKTDAEESMEEDEADDEDESMEENDEAADDDADMDSASDSDNPPGTDLAATEAAIENEDDLPDVLELDQAEWDFGLTALSYGVLAGSVPVIDALLDAGASIQPEIEFHRLPLTVCLAIRDDDVAVTVATRLIERGARTSAATPESLTVFHQAVVLGKTRLVDLFLKKESNLDRVMNHPTLPSGWRSSFVSPVVSAVVKDDYNILARLLAYGASTEPTEESVGEAILALDDNRRTSGNTSADAAHRPLEAAIATFSDLAFALMDIGAAVNIGCQSSFDQYSDSSNWRSLLDAVRHQLQIARNAIADPEESSNDTEREPTRTSDTAPTWLPHLNELMNRRYVLSQKKDEFQLKNEKDQKERAEQALKGRKTAVKYLEEIEARLLKAGAKTWNEIFPKERESTAQKEPASRRNRQDKQSSTEPAYELLSAAYSRTGVPPHQVTRYDELFEAAFTGDTEKIKTLCLPENKKDSALQIAVQVKLKTQQYESTGYTPLFAALANKKYATARFILAVAAAQYHPGEGKKQKFSLRDIELDEEDEDEDIDDEDDDMSLGSEDTVNQEKVTFVDIANSSSQVRCKIEPRTLLEASSNFPHLDGTNHPWGSALVRAIQADDFDDFVQIANMYKLLPDQPVPLDDQNKNVLASIILGDKPDFLHEYIKRTAFVVPLEKRDEDGDEDDEEGAKLVNDKNKIYLGLNVHGKKRADLARKSDPDSVDTSSTKYEPAVWQATSRHAVKLLEYLASDRPLEAVQAYAQSTNSEQATKIRNAKNLARVLPTWLGWTTTAVGENPMVPMLLGEGSDEGETKRYQKVLAIGNKFKGIMSLQFRIKFSGQNAFLLAAEQRLRADMFKLLVNSGVDHTAVDYIRGYNIFHILAAPPKTWHKDDPSLDLLVALLDLLPKEDTDAMLLQRSKERLNTPLLVALKNQRNLIAKAFIERSDPSALITPDVNGMTPLHIATANISYKHNLELVKLLLEKLPADQVHVENAVGQTALDALSLAWLQKAKGSLEGSVSSPSVLAERYSSNVNYPDYRRKESFIKKQTSAAGQLQSTLDELKALGKGTDKVIPAFTNFAANTPSRLAEVDLMPASDSDGDTDTNESAEPDTFMNETLRLLLAVPQVRRRVHLLDVQASVKHDLGRAGMDEDSFDGEDNDWRYNYRRNKRKSDEDGLEGEEEKEEKEKNTSWSWNALKVKREKV
ncbi:ankyrin repeat protein [Flagelloscypha sp. PMI_526]|nr:ankyrin repeat protein [Flagelloscypha sp. PMI_526]